MEYLGILCIKNKNIYYKYIKQLESSLNQVCQSVIRVLYGDDGFPEIGKVLKQIDFSTYEGIVVLKDELFGAFYNLDSLMKKMNGKYDVWGLYYDVEKSREKRYPVLYDGFFVMEKRLMESPGFLGGLETGQWADYTFYGEGVERGGAVLKECMFCKKNQINQYIYMPYEVVVRKNSPFLPIKCFFTDEILKYSIQHELRRIIDHLEKNHFDTDGIWEYIIAEFDMGDLRRMLHLDYPIYEKHGGGVYGKRVAIFAHIYYADLYDKCISYFEKIPGEADLYVSTSKSGIGILEEKLKRRNVAVKKIIAAGERGRDAGALLVGFAPYLGLYDYICFVHDKKSSGGIAPISEGMSFMDLVWDNLMPNQDYIYQIIKIFEEHKYLGVIAPPIPVMGSYFSSIVGNEWTVCYEETKKLADKLNVKIKISEEKLPFVLSTCFWCRPEALKDLFCYPWKIEDFPEEPLKLDGAINHAVERVVPYLAQIRGYYSALAYQMEYASLYTSNLSYIVDEIFKGLRESEFVAVKFPVDLRGELDFIKRLFLFTVKHTEIYVYGAGAQGKIIKKKLDTIGVKPKAFLVSSWRGNEKSFEGYEVYLFEDIKGEIGSRAGIILALSNKFADEVVPGLGGLDYFRIDVE